MGVLLFALGSVLLSLAVQLVLWRIRLPRRQAMALLVIFSAVPALLYLLLVAGAGSFPSSGILLPSGPAELLHALLLIASLTGAWLMTYSAVEVDSPSIHIVHAVARAGADGMAEEDLRAAFTDEVLLFPRIADLVTDRMVVLEGETYRLTRKGRYLADFFTVYRRLLGLGTGG
jgi:hypothetical protein